MLMTIMAVDTSSFKTLHNTEDWKYTNVSALSKIDFCSKCDFDPQSIAQYDIAPNNPLVVFVNGEFQEFHSRLQEGIEINKSDLRDIASRADSKIPRGESDTLSITGNQTKTIHVLQIIAGDASVACFGNVYIHAKDGETISAAQTHVALVDGEHLFMPCTQIVAQQNSTVTLLNAIRGSKQAYQLSSLHVEQHTR
jgi:hypothetical protein